MASDPVTAGAHQASRDIGVLKDGLPKGQEAARLLCSGLQDLIQGVSIARKAQALAERQVEELRGHLAEVKDDATEGQETALRRIGQLELQLGQVQDLADVRVKEAEDRAKERADRTKEFATLEGEKAKMFTAAMRDDLKQLADTIDSLAAESQPLRAESQPLRKENQELRARLAQARAHLPTKSEAEGRIDHLLSEQCKDAKRIDELEEQVAQLRRRLRESEDQRKTEGEALSQEVNAYATKNQALRRELEVTKRTLQEVQNRHQEEIDEIMVEMQTLNTSTEKGLRDINEDSFAPTESIEVTRLKAELVAERLARIDAEDFTLKERTCRRMAEARVAEAKARGAEEERTRISAALLSDGTLFANFYNQLRESGMDTPDLTNPIELVNTVAQQMILAMYQAQEPGGSS